MIEKFADLDLLPKDDTDQVDAKLRDKLGLGFQEMAQTLSKVLQDKAEELTHDFMTVAPYADYGQLLEDNVSMAKFFREEAHKPENWKPVVVGHTEEPEMIKVEFRNLIVDDGHTMLGMVFISKTGVIRHAFVQGDV